MVIKAIIFDMDGVIINSEPIYEKSTIKMMKEIYNINLSKKVLEKTKGMRDVDEFNFFKKEFNLDNPIDELIENRKKYFLENAKNIGIVLEGSNDKLIELNKSYILGMTTSTQEDMFEFASKFFDRNLFKFITTGKDVIKGKPNPEGYLRTITALNLHPTECIIVEDALNGVQAGKNAGAKVIGVLGSFDKNQLIEAGADLVLPDMTHITKEIIEEL